VWNEHPLGYALEGQTIGDYGCGLSAAAMVLTYYGYTTTPPVLNDALKQNKGFSGSLLVWKADQWKKATKGFIQGVADYRPWHKDWKRREEILRENVEVGRPVIVYLNNAHYVVVTRYDPAKEEFYINDPWLGSEKGVDIPFEENAKGLSLSSITQMVILYPQPELPPTVDWPSIRERYIQTGGEKGVLGPALQDDEEYTFPDGAKAMVYNRNISRCRNEFATYVHGTKRAGQFSGNIHAATTHIYQDTQMSKDSIWWKAAKEPCSPWQAEWNVLLEKVRKDERHNETERAVLANFAANMGRAAVHYQRVVTWVEMLNSKFLFCPYVDELNWDSPPPVREGKDGHYPAPVPGQWKEL